MANLYIICGHGAGDPGACAAGQTEEERVRYLASRIKALGGDQVEVLDTSRNWYADKGLNTLTIPKDGMLLELHRDSFNDPNAKGAHVEIKSGYKADSFDEALAKKLSSIFPGRSEIIKKRTDLANANRAGARGINYRLAEVGFISNAEDRAIFDTRTDEIARAILEACGLSAGEASAPSGGSAPGGQETNGGMKVYGFPVVKRGAKGNAVYIVQGVLNVRFGCSLALDGSCGPATEAAIRSVQTILGLEQDGSCGPLTWQAILAA